MAKGNAGNYSYGDMQRDKAELDAVNEPEWIVEHTTFMKPDEFNRSIAKIKEAAVRKGRVIGVKEQKGGYKVTVERPNPKYRGKKK